LDGAGFRRGTDPDREKARVLKAARNIFFADRSGDRLMNRCAMPSAAIPLSPLLAFSGGTIPSVKSADAAEAVRLGASLASAFTEKALEIVSGSLDKRNSLNDIGQ